jgi:ABC-type nitrate/sulfonate/bicarbonate transport system substrate-binding protein
MDRRTFLAGMTGGAVGLILSRRDAETADPLRLGYQVNIWGSLSVVALKSGLCEKAGLPVEGIRSPVGRQTRDAMVAGRRHTCKRSWKDC